MSLHEQQKLLNPISPNSSKANDNGQTSGAHGRHGVASEYRFIHQRIPEHIGKKQNIILSILLLSVQVAFIILFAFFGNYDITDGTIDDNEKKYPSK